MSYNIDSLTLESWWRAKASAFLTGASENNWRDIVLVALGFPRLQSQQLRISESTFVITPLSSIIFFSASHSPLLPTLLITLGPPEQCRMIYFKIWMLKSADVQS